jgi:hypothetical protein
LGTKQPLLEVDPLCLPLGMLVGPWRVKGFRSRGSYGSLYRVERVGREGQGSFALKLAVYPRDERFAREAWLLSRIQSPYVPRLYAQGVWEHPSGAFPYLVMEWIDGEPLYEWAGQRNPTERQVLRVLAQVARALEATHAAGGVHRDVKGGNVLVRPMDGRAFLTDFGAGHYRGAATLTSKLLPPSTPAYRSPEAWAFLHAFRRHPTIVYPASACDDLFALGVMAYRLVTDEYPPSTDPDEPGAEVWREGGVGPRPPRELSPQVSPVLDSILRRLLAVAPEERFRGKVRGAAEALEQAERVRTESDTPLFSWGLEDGIRRRSREGVRRLEEWDASMRAQLALSEAKERAGAEAARELAPPRVLVRVWGTEMAVAFLGLLLAGLAVAWLHPGLMGPQDASAMGSRPGDIVAVGDRAVPASMLAPMHTDNRQPGVGLPMPEKPFPGQRTPPCNRVGEEEIRAGCWYLLGTGKPPCKEDAYDWKGACYLPSFPPRRQPTTRPP